MARKVLFTALRNEGPYIVEWVAYHRLIGFTDIIVFSNDCDDGSDVLLDALLAEGVVQHFAHHPPPELAAQKMAAEKALELELFRDGDWVMWLDLDEFLFIPFGQNTLDDLLAEAPEFDAMSFAWRFFGDGGVKKWPGRQIGENFVWAERIAANRKPQVKTLFRFDSRIERLDIHRPILNDGAEASGFSAISSSGKPMDTRFFRRKRHVPFNRIVDGSDYYRLGTVLHFAVRTPDMFALKSARGDGYFPANANPVVRDAKFYRQRNKNEVKIEDHLVMLPRLDMAIEALRGPVIAAGLERLFPVPLPRICADSGADDHLYAALKSTDLIHICDIGANPIDEVPSYRSLLAKGLGRLTGFEPQPEAYTRLVAENRKNKIYHPIALGDGRDRELNIYSGSGFSSLFPISEDTRNTLANLTRYTTLKEKISVQTQRLDQVDEVPAIDFLKIDVQGSELDIIENAGVKLAQAVVIQTEVRFIPLYQDEPTFGDLDRCLQDMGFLLFDFVTLKRFKLNSPYSGEIRRTEKRQLLDGDAIYIRDIRKLDLYSGDQLKKLAMIFLEALPNRDVVVFALSELARRGEIDGDLIEGYIARS